MEETRNTYEVLVGKPVEKRPLRRPSRTWENIIKMDPREIGWGGMDWIRLAQDKDQWFRKILENSWAAERLVASQEELSSM
jgi:hypothetical protein